MEEVIKIAYLGLSPSGVTHNWGRAVAYLNPRPKSGYAALTSPHSLKSFVIRWKSTMLCSWSLMMYSDLSLSDEARFQGRTFEKTGLALTIYSGCDALTSPCSFSLFANKVRDYSIFRGYLCPFETSRKCRVSIF